MNGFILILVCYALLCPRSFGEYMGETYAKMRIAFNNEFRAVTDKEFERLAKKKN